MEYRCTECNKIYSSYQSRWLHIKKYHKTLSAKLPPKCRQNRQNIHKIPPNPAKMAEIESLKFVCTNCEKIFTRKDSLNKHINLNRCKCEKNNKTELINILKKEVLNDPIFKNELLKSLKIHPKTLQKINNQLNNNNINNGTINYNIVQLGNENLEDILSSKEKMKILNKKGNSLKEIVELVHISNKYNQFKNVYITNLQNTIGYKFDSNNNKFIAVNKSDLLDDIIDCRMYDIQTFYNEMETSFDEETKKIIKRFIDRMNDNDDNLKGLKKDEIKLLLYNSREKIQSTNKIDIEL
jgi:hypothetical protein